MIKGIRLVRSFDSAADAISSLSDGRDPFKLSLSTLCKKLEAASFTQIEVLTMLALSFRTDTGDSDLPIFIRYLRLIKATPQSFEQARVVLRLKLQQMRSKRVRY